MTIKDNVHWFIGMYFGKRYRMWYYKTHNKSWLWGIYSFLNNGEMNRKKLKEAKRSFNDYLKLLNVGDHKIDVAGFSDDVDQISCEYGSFRQIDKKNKLWVDSDQYVMYKYYYYNVYKYLPKDEVLLYIGTALKEEYLCQRKKNIKQSMLMSFK